MIRMRSRGDRRASSCPGRGAQRFERIWRVSWGRIPRRIWRVLRGWVLRGWEVERGLRRSSSPTGSPRCWLVPSANPSAPIARAYDRHLFNGGTPTLQDLPDRPRFVINATNQQSGAVWRFSNPYMRDWRVGRGGPAEACSVACRRGLLGLSALSLATVSHARPSGLVGGSPLRHSPMRERRSRPDPSGGVPRSPSTDENPIQSQELINRWVGRH
jgi:hypothetical protein